MTEQSPAPEQSRVPVAVWGEADARVVAQIERCAADERVAGAALMADNHLGYSQPIGGVVAYRGAVSPSGVGYDIGCGNKAVRTNLNYEDMRRDLPRLADEIARRISFGIGRKNNEPVDHPVLDDDRWRDLPEIAHLHKMACDQLGTVGSGNHYVDLFHEPASGKVWVGVHFGSRGFGHQTATGFLNLAAGKQFTDRAAGGSMDQSPTVIDVATPLGQSYLTAMELAGAYAYAGRDLVTAKVLGILGAKAEFEVHNHHNYAWRERHDGEELYVVRKGATPCWPGQLGFVGGSMGDIAVIIRGRDNEEAARSLYSTVHGAGRVMSRTQAAGKVRRVRGPGGAVRRERIGGLVDEAEMRAEMRRRGVELRGGGADEAPQVYRKLQTVLDAHAGYVDVLHVLEPIVVVMAGSGEYDPYKD